MTRNQLRKILDTLDFGIPFRIVSCSNTKATISLSYNTFILNYQLNEDDTLDDKRWKKKIIADRKRNMKYCVKKLREKGFDIIEKDLVNIEFFYPKYLQKPEINLADYELCDLP